VGWGVGWARGGGIRGQRGEIKENQVCATVITERNPGPPPPTGRASRGRGGRLQVPRILPTPGRKLHRSKMLHSRPPEKVKCGGFFKLSESA
jgi:hypothetical protein